MLGKRKREAIVVRRTQTDHDITPTATDEATNANDLFRKYFEASFDPLPESKQPTPPTHNDEDDSDAFGDLEDDLGSDEAPSEWSGISDDGDGVTEVKIVDYTNTAQTVDNDPISKIFQKSFMSSKPPKESQSESQSHETSQAKIEDDVEENLNLKHDLDLQRLLRESHLLEQSMKQPAGGAQRHKATDLRMLTLGSKASLFNQEKMPMSHRKGIQSKASAKDKHRRREARENGIIIEKPSQKSSTSGSRRDRGVDIPVVGKFKGGTLQLSRKDVASIQGSRRQGSKRKRR